MSASRAWEHAARYFNANTADARPAWAVQDQATCRLPVRESRSHLVPVIIDNPRHRYGRAAKFELQAWQADGCSRIACRGALNGNLVSTQVPLGVAQCVRLSLFAPGTPSSIDSARPVKRLTMHKGVASVGYTDLVT